MLVTIHTRGELLLTLYTRQEEDHKQAATQERRNVQPSLHQL